ncbi:MAG: hypothetical protein GC200_05710 [Tepidisphaera sp.]|nr:hypothetical protein [Tepidisphaera sp.]
MPRSLMPNRRAHPRLRAEFAAKVYHVATKRWLPAMTCDTSAGGTLVKVRSERLIEPGEELHVHIAPDLWTIAAAKGALVATVLRCGRNQEGEQYLALKYRRDEMSVARRSAA